MLKQSLFFATFLFFLLAFASTKAQTTNDSLPDLTFVPKIEIGLVQGIGLGVELPVSQKSMFEIGAGLGSGYYIYDNSFNNTWTINNPAFYTKLKYKLYYNRQKRLDKGKNMLNNAGNYVAFRFKYTTPELSSSTDMFGNEFYELSNATLFDVNWGIQRPMGKRFLFNLNLGLGYAYDWDYQEGSVYPAANIHFGYRLW